MQTCELRQILVIAGALLGLAAAGAQPEPAPVFIRPAGVPADQKTALFIFLHGSGSSPAECAPVLQPLAEAWRVALFLPCGSRQGGVRPDGVAAYDWEPAADVPAVLKAIRALKGIHPRGVFLMGFSSGAAMCYRLALAQPGLFAGVIVFSGILPGAYRAGQQKLPAAGTVPFYLVQGDADTAVPAARAQEARDFLKQRGFPVQLKIFPGRHFLPDDVFDVIKEAVDWFDAQGQAAPPAIRKSP